MTKFYLVRHGKTINNVESRLSGWIDTPLVPDGLEPTKRVIEKLRGMNFDAVYASDLGRAFVTAYEITYTLEIPVKIITSSGLREVNYGDAANMLSSEAYERFPQLDRDTHYTPPCGESLDHMQRRIIATLNEINEGMSDGSVLVVAHSGVMAALNAAYQNIDFGGHNISEAYPHDYVAVCTVENGVVTSFEQFNGVLNSTVPGVA